MVRENKDSGHISTLLKMQDCGKCVTSLQFCALSGLLVVAHLSGEVRVYQFSSPAHEIVTYEASGKSRKKLNLQEESGRSVRVDLN